MKTLQYHKCFETLANELRLQIIDNLAKKPMSVEELSKKLNAERSRVSHSLQVLKTCSYVETEKQGKQRIYSLKKDVLEGMKRENPSNLFGFVDQHFESYCNCECRKTL